MPYTPPDNSQYGKDTKEKQKHVHITCKAFINPTFVTGLGFAFKRAGRYL